MRRRLVLLGLLIVLAPPAAAQVPVFDLEAFLRGETAFERTRQDLALQGRRRTAQGAMADIERAQLAALDQILGALSGGAGTGPMIASLEGEKGTPGSAGTLYGPPDPNPGAARLFGDAGGTVEALIIQVAKDTAGYPGVAAAGLSTVQWRCLLQALIWQESRFQVGARSPAAAFGLTQIIPDTARALGIYPAYYEDPYLQVEGGARYLSQQLAAFRGDVVLALAAYNAGPGAVEDHGGVPPYPETQAYVRAIPAKYNAYLGLVGGIDAQGTIDPVLLAASTYSMTSDAALVYGGHMEAAIALSARRLRAIVARIGETRGAQAALALNTDARAELARLMAMTVRLAAARAVPAGAGEVAHAASRAAERAFSDFTLELLP